MKKPFIAICIAVIGAVTQGAKIDFAARAEANFTGTVRRARSHDRQLGVIELFYAAYYFCESGRHLDCLDLLFDTAAEMQDRAPESRGYGNYRWYYRDGFVMDYNAVDFCMQPGSLMARRHLQKMPPSARAKFERLLELSIQGCLRHQVRPSYTNIAIMNAVNLILLGESQGRADVFSEGARRLNGFMLNTALFGVCEYSSPTYSAVDILNLHRLHAGVKDAGVKSTCERLLRLFWTDACASALPGAGRLGGAHSRDYDYLYGMGEMARLLRAAGVAPPLAGKNREEPPLEFALDDWRPDAETRALATRAGRFVESRWGEEEDKVRYFWAGRNVSLGVAGANYWNMDIPLAVDIAATNRIARGYFIADGRRDPYGRKKIPEDQGPHQKTLHLRPFWAGTQRGRDALGMVVYRGGDVPADTPTLESHFVFPREVDEVYVGDEAVQAKEGSPWARPLPAGTCVFVRKGGGGFGLRVPWGRDMAGNAAQMALVWDDATDGAALRVTVAHHDFWGRTLDPERLPGAVFWVRVADDLEEAGRFAAFRAEFASATATATVSDRRVEVSAAGVGGRLALQAEAPFDVSAGVEPVPGGAVLAVDGRDVGREILGEVPGVAEYYEEQERVKRIMAENQVPVSLKRNSTWEAESGAVVTNMVVASDPGAHGGKFVWGPGRRGDRGGGDGTVSWRLQVQEAGTYTLWGRVSTATPEDDSFWLRVHAGSESDRSRGGGRKQGRTLLPSTAWHLGTTGGPWRWTAFPLPLELPRGPVALTLGVREDGAKLDRLFLSSDPTQEPER